MFAGRVPHRFALNLAPCAAGDQLPGCEVLVPALYVGVVLEQADGAHPYHDDDLLHILLVLLLSAVSSLSSLSAILFVSVCVILYTSHVVGK